MFYSHDLKEGCFTFSSVSWFYNVFRLWLPTSLALITCIELNDSTQMGMCRQNYLLFSELPGYSLYFAEKRMHCVTTY